MEKLKGIKAILFDFDGTLVNIPINYKKIRLELKKLFLIHGIKTDFKIILKSIEKAYKIKDHEKVNKLVNEAFSIVTKYEISGAKRAKEVLGAHNLLKKLKEHGFKIAIISRNSYESIEIALKKTKLDKYIDLIISREDVKKIKPHPEMIKKALGYLKLKSSEVLVVGDHLYDIIAASRAKVISIGIKTKHSDFSNCHPDFIVSDLKQLLKLI
ncbi:MAG: HAD family hydrolase [Candidatus Parvarchaeota archaeon]|nr:HAD family hydrolase [Candidatus Jingweiarchaeum tengchongense]MCW1310755.1 HAD family hydrolase [Candidatus Jingweiarchaeum tengchongense]